MKCLIFLLLFSASCIDQPVTELYSTAKDARGQLRERVRSRSLNDSSGQCSESKRCRENCEDIYLKAVDLDRCYDSTENRVKDISEVFEVLINPNRLSDLNDIETVDFSHFLNIGYRGFLDLVDPVHRDEDGDRRNIYWEDIHAYDPGSAQLVLEWIANEEKIARSILSRDDNLDIVRHLFCIAGRSIPFTESEQKQYICDSWDINGTQCNNLTESQLEEWTFTAVDWSASSPPLEQLCHDNPLSIYIGLTQAKYDDVGFSTYAEAQDNGNALRIEENLIADICGNDQTCRQFYICPVLTRYEGYEIATTDDPYCSDYRQNLDRL